MVERHDISGCKVAPLGQCSNAVEFETLPVVEMAFLIEVIVN
jgi:hypothetical protein